MNLRDWVISRLEQVISYDRVLVCDPLGILPIAYGAIDTLAEQHGFTVIRAYTNLAFRDTYERLLQDAEVKKIMLLDQTPQIRLQKRGIGDAPPLFYPDFLEKCPEEARLPLDLRQYLRDVTADGSWPQACNEPAYARLMIPCLPAVLRAYQNLRAVDDKSFTDSDFDTIVAFAALGIPELAFKKLEAEDYWRIGLLGHETLYKLKTLSPQVSGMFNAEMMKAPIPFCWFASRDPEVVVNGFYLCAILCQHSDNWRLLLGNIDPALSDFKGIEEALLKNSAPRLVAIDPVQAERDLANLEQSLDSEQLELILLDQLRIEEIENAVALIEKESYSTLFRSLALLVVLHDMLSDKPSKPAHKRLQATLIEPQDFCLADQRNDPSWQHLIKTYKLLLQLEPLRKQLLAAQKELSVKKAEQLDFNYFRSLWIDKQLGHLEYLTSALERKIGAPAFLPRNPDRLPSAFGELLTKIHTRVLMLCDEINFKIDFINSKFQDMIALRYTTWIDSTHHPGGPVLTSSFLEKCLRPYWDQPNEKAVILIFDGMRYDIWDLLLKESLLESMEIIQEFPGLALLPTETHISRKAISAAAYPDQFDGTWAENKLLNVSLSRLYNTAFDLTVVGGGTGETVHYATDNLDVYIFELCDTELHNIKVKQLADGREIPSRPLAYIYQQQVQNILENEVKAIFSKLSPGTMVFITADHGFARMGRKPLALSDAWLHMPQDCSYQNSLLDSQFSAVKAGHEIKQQMIAFTPQQLRLPVKTTRFDKQQGKAREHEFKSVVFPRVGYSFRRPGAPFKPDAFSHGGISLQEMLIPMVVLKVKAPDQGLLSLGVIDGPQDVLEGETLVFSACINYHATSLFAEETRVEVRARYAADDDKYPLPSQVLYVGTAGDSINYTFVPDAGDASTEERRHGVMSRVFTLEIVYRDGHKTVHKTRTKRFNVKLNADKVVRRLPTSLGNILGMTPKSMR